MNFGDALAPDQKMGNGLCILAKPLHGHRQTIRSLKARECIERAHAGSRSSQQGNSLLEDIGHGNQTSCGLDPGGFVVAGVRLGKQGKSMGTFSPVRFATICNQAACEPAIYADIFRTEIHNFVRPMGERSADDGQCGVVHDQRNPHVLTNYRHLGNGKSPQLGIGRKLSIKGSFLVIASAPKICRIDQSNLVTTVFPGVGKEIPGSTVEIYRTNNIVSRSGDVLDCQS